MLKKIGLPILLILAAGLAIGCATFFILRSRSDNGFIEEAGRLGKMACGELRWDRSRIPVPVYLDTGTSEVTGEAQAAVAWWNGQLGFEAFSWQAQAWIHDGGREPRSILLSSVEDGSLVLKGKTEYQAVNGLGHCRLISAHVKVPGRAQLESEELRAKVWRHELGHALGLDHDSQEESVMYWGGRAALWGMNKAMEGDLERLREAYKATE